MDLQPYYDELSKTKIQLMATPDSAFFIHLCFSLKHRFDFSVPTAATNGKEIIFNPQFFMKLDKLERVSLLLHETLHCAYLHMLRLLDRDPLKWNIAGDHVINLHLIERNFKVPKEWLADPQYKGMSTEQVYALLPNDPNAKCDIDLLPMDGPEEQIEKDMQDILVRASLQSKMAGDKAGTIPGDIEIFLNRLLNPKLPWERILQKYLHTLAKHDYSYRRPNRRFMPQYYLPSLYTNKLMDISIAIDTSGSVTDQEFTQFISETHSILKMMRPDKITIIQFDTELKSVDCVKNISELMHVKFTGRGGTLIGPVLEWADEHKPQLLLVFTDGHFRFYGQETKANTIWLIHDNQNFKSSFGKTIHYSMKD